MIESGPVWSVMTPTLIDELAAFVGSFTAFAPVLAASWLRARSLRADAPEPL
jgi:hypothetical protein